VHGSITRGADRWGRAQCRAAVNSIQKISNEFKFISNSFKLDSLQKGSSQLKKIEIKYGCEVFEIRNNFPYRNFFRIEMDFK
jgi:hypothetical protein